MSLKVANRASEEFEMKKLKLHQYFVIIFFICLCTFLIIANLSKPRILILHSYSQDFSWVNDIDSAIQKDFEKKPYSLRWHYMDTKRNPYKDFKIKAGHTAREVIDSWKPDVIIAVDDNAQEFVTKYYKNDPDISIVYTGLNAQPEKYGFDHAKNVTGVLERIPYEAVKEGLIHIMSKDRNKILHISDSSETSLYIHDELKSFSWKPLKLVDSIQVDTFDEWKKMIKEKEKEADFLLITHYHTIERSDKDSTIVPPEEVIAWTEKHSSIPRLGCWGFYVEDGGMMAVAVSPLEQGEIAAKMAIKIVENHIPANKIPVEKNKLFVMYLREGELEKYHIKLPLMYQAFARATNHYYTKESDNQEHADTGH